MELTDMLDEISALQERFLKAGEKTDEIPETEPQTDSSRTSQESQMLKMLFYNAETVISLIDMLKLGASKDLYDGEKLSSFQGGVQELSDYVGECISKYESGEDANQEDEEEADETEKEDDAEEEEEGPDPEEVEVKETGSSVDDDDEEKDETSDEG